GYLIDQFENYKLDPLSVVEEMRRLFDEMNESDFFDLDLSAAGDVSVAPVENEKTYAAMKLADQIRTYGHLAADIYPLGN
ncbi:hypothetical protein RYX45_25060, partial [Alkalihalophilus pseudofirmus]